MYEIFVHVLNPGNATCADGQAGVCVSQLLGSIPDNLNIWNSKPYVNIVQNFGFHNNLTHKRLPIVEDTTPSLVRR